MVASQRLKNSFDSKGGQTDREQSNRGSILQSSGNMNQLAKANDLMLTQELILEVAMDESNL